MFFTSNTRRVEDEQIYSGQNKYYCSYIASITVVTLKVFTIVCYFLYRS
jgi:hypothetical protein